MNVKQLISGFTFTALIAAFTACEETGGCESCDSFYPPDSLGLEVAVTINDKHQYVPIAVYFDNVDNDPPVFRDTLRESPVTYLVPAEERYGVTAEYKVDESTVVAVDGDRVHYRSVSDCDTECYAFKEGEVDLVLE